MSCIPLLLMFFAVVHRFVYGPTIEETFQEVSELQSEDLEDLLDAMVFLSKESLTFRGEKIVSGNDKKLIPEKLDQLSPHSIHLNQGQVHVLLNKQNDKSLSLALRQRGDHYYVLLNFRDELYRSNLYRELYPTNRIEELVEPVGRYNSGQSLRD
ncbi:hypothetical protein [Pelagicoccus sp. SDUM812003]|uniref:hypothetical protein n=1 Tax=Pelagicoccus sp. SDUM812003 TaxID=3041267 RepID=UPI00280EFFAA|nr:hypothetical protein [Pelagicoccus sp. SDUM812003]MDQ8205760.1 hypothetical protein [Pelagicoccus sp. SDUM812003]